MASKKILRSHSTYIYSLLIMLFTAFLSSINVKADDRLNMTLDSLEHKLAWIDYRQAQEEWKKQVSVGGDSLTFFNKFKSAILGKKELFETLQSGRNSIEDEKQRRRFNLLYPQVIREYVDSKLSLRVIVDSIEFFHDSRWCLFESQFKSPADLQYLIRNDDKQSRRESAYRILGSPNEVQKDQLPRLIRLRNQEARRLGYNDYFSLLYGQTGKAAEDYEKVLEDVDNATKGAYDELVNRLKGTSGNNLEIWDVLYKSNSQSSIINNLFPVDSQINIAKRTFESLGFILSNLPIYFTLTQDMTDNGSTKTIIIDVPGDVRVMADMKDGWVGFSNLVSAVAEAVRVTKVTEQSPLFARQIDPACREANQSLIKMLISDKKWLTSVVSATQNQVTQVEQVEFDSRLLQIRLMLVNAAWELKVYRNRSADLNELYWELFEKYIGLPKHENLTPWVIIPEIISQPFSQMSHLEATMAATQTYAYINANYANGSINKEVGSFLIHNFYRFGSRYEWRELVERATGNRLSAAFLTGR